MNCKDCIHYDVCFYLKRVNETDLCECFQNKSEWIHLPCNVGDTVYYVTDRYRHYKEFEIVETTVTKVGKNKKGIFFQMQINSIYETALSAIGKTVFLTRKEAEKTLTERRI